MTVPWQPVDVVMTTFYVTIATCPVTMAVCDVTMVTLMCHKKHLGQI